MRPFVDWAVLGVEQCWSSLSVKRHRMEMSIGHLEVSSQGGIDLVD